MTNPVGIQTKPKPPAKKPTENGGMGSGKAPAVIEGDRDLDVETHKNKPRVKPQTLSKAFESAGYITTMSEDKQGVVVPQNSETLAKHLTNKGWSRDSYQVKNGSRIESLSKGSNRITLYGEGSRTIAYATRGHEMITNGGPGSGPRPGQGKGRKSGKSQSASPAEHSNIAFAATTKARETGTKEDHEHAAQMHARASDAHLLSEDGNSSLGMAHSDLSDKHSLIAKAGGSVSAKESKSSGTVSAKQVLDDLDRWQQKNSARFFPGGRTNNQEESVMTKEEKNQIIQALTSNCKCQTANQFDESDKEYLSGLSDEKLQRLVANRQKLIDADKKAKATANQETPEEDETETPAMTDNSSKSKTAYEPSLQEWLKAAPKEVRSAVLNAQRIEAKQKESLISKLTANVRDEDKLENLKGIYGNMSVETLESLVEALPAAPVATQNRRQPNYGGAGSPIYTQQQTATANAEETNDLVSAMTPPTFNWSEIAGQKDNGRRISK